MYTPEQYRMAIAATIRAERARRDVTQDMIIRQTGISKSTVIRIERGASVLNTDQLCAIGAVFGVTAGYLLAEAERQLAAEIAPPPESLNDADDDPDRVLVAS